MRSGPYKGQAAEMPFPAPMGRMRSGPYKDERAQADHRRRAG